MKKIGVQFRYHSVRGTLFMDVSEEVAFFDQMLKEDRRKIMKRLLFEDCDSNSLHLLLSRSVFSASDRLREQTDKRVSLV